MSVSRDAARHDTIGSSDDLSLHARIMTRPISAPMPLKMMSLASRYLRRSSWKHHVLVPLVDDAERHRHEPRSLQRQSRLRERQHQERVLRVVDVLDRVQEQERLRQQHRRGDANQAGSDDGRRCRGHHQSAAKWQRQRRGIPTAVAASVLEKSEALRERVEEVRYGQVQREVEREKTEGRGQPGWRQSPPFAHDGSPR